MDFWFVTGMILLLGALEYAMPQLTRKDIFFSVTVPPELRSSPEAAVILASYRRGIVGVTIVVLVLAILNARYGSNFGRLADA
jgi:Trk-type K+ transport system membrane component